VLARPVIAPYTRRIVDPPRLKFLSRPDWLLFSPPGTTPGNVHAQRIDLRERRLVGPASLLVQGVTSGAGRTALVTGGALMLVDQDDGVRRFTARVVAGTVRDTLSDTLDLFYRPRVAHDGARLVEGGFMPSLWEPRRALRTSLLSATAESGPPIYPVWSPGDSLIAFMWQRMLQTIRVRDGVRTVLYVDSLNAREMRPWDWSPDGRWLLYERLAGDDARYNEIWALDVTTRSARIVVSEAGDAGAPRLSPDGTRLAYQRRDDNGIGVYVRPFPGPGPSVRVLAGPAASPHWSADGRSLYLLRDGVVVRVPVAPNGEATAPPVVVLTAAQLPWRPPQIAADAFDVGGDGTIYVRGRPPAAPAFTLIRNWPALIARRERGQ
jgi:hypothetical protein